MQIQVGGTARVHILKPGDVIPKSIDFAVHTVSFLDPITHEPVAVSRPVVKPKPAKDRPADCKPITKPTGATFGHIDMPVKPVEKSSPPAVLIDQPHPVSVPFPDDTKPLRDAHASRRPVQPLTSIQKDHLRKIFAEGPSASDEDVVAKFHERTGREISVWTVAAHRP